MIAAEDDEKNVGELIALAQRELHGDSALSDDAGFARLQARMGRPKSTLARKATWAGGIAALAASVALTSGVVLRSQADAITFQVSGGQITEDGRVLGVGATRIRFSDGSEAELQRGSEASVEALSEHGGRVVLKSGTMQVKIAKVPQAAWVVAAGPYDVKVTGTAFDVSWSSQEQAFDLRMQSGSVIVTGPLALSGIPVQAGQRMFGGVREGRLSVEGRNPQASQALLEPPTTVAPNEAPTASPLTPNAPGAASARPGPEPSSWTRSVAQGRFDEVLADAEHRGLDRTLASAPLQDLAALADARYAGRTAIAKRVLMAERQRFPSSPAARDAAFFLGRIAEDEGGGAVEWYERYVAESPRGSYASQAVGRKMMLLYKQRGVAAAKPVARDYLSRYPGGPYAASARKISEESPSAVQP